MRTFCRRLYFMERKSLVMRKAFSTDNYRFHKIYIRCFIELLYLSHMFKFGFRLKEKEYLFTFTLVIWCASVFMLYLSVFWGIFRLSRPRMKSLHYNEDMMKKLDDSWRHSNAEFFISIIPLFPSNYLSVLQDHFDPNKHLMKNLVLFMSNAS